MIFSFELEDFEKYQWKEIIDNSQVKECRQYSNLFEIEAKKYRQSNDKNGENIFAFLGILTSFFLETLTFELSNSEKYYPNLFSEKNLNILNQLIENINDPEMKARMADILWSHKIEIKKRQKFISSDF